MTATETARFLKHHRKSKRLFERGKRSLIAGVPMNWMVRWAGPYPIFVDEAKGAHVKDVDGNRYLDLCCIVLNCLSPFPCPSAPMAFSQSSSPLPHLGHLVALGAIC